METTNNQMSRVVVDNRAPKGLHFPNNTVPDSVSEKPHYVFILTNEKTFDELYRSKYNSHNERRKFVLHSLRLYNQFDEAKLPLEDYDVEEDKNYGAAFAYISPGLSYDRPLDHRKHQYTEHGFATGLSQTQYFENMIKLYDHFDFNGKLLKIANSLVTAQRRVQISYHKWNIVDEKAHAERLKRQLYGRNPGICYARNKDKDLKFDYEYFLYLNEKFQIVDAPDDKKVEYLKDKYIPISNRYNFYFSRDEKA